MRRLLTSFIVLATMLTYCLDASAWTDVKLHGNFYGSWADIAGSGSNNNWSFTIDGTKMTDGSTYEFGLRCENGTEFYASSVTFNFSSSATQSQTIAKANSGNMKFVHNATYTSYSVRVSFASEQWTISISGSTSGGGGGDNAYYLVIQDGINLQRIPIMDEKCLMMLRNQCFTKMCNYSIIFIYSYISRGYDAKDSYM